MLRLRHCQHCTLLTIILAGCVVYEPVPTPTTRPASFDRSWNAAILAAQDVGIHVSMTDRSAGQIFGQRNTASVTINLLQQADGSLRVKFDVKNLSPQDQGLGDRFSAAYDRRMGR